MTTQSRQETGQLFLQRRKDKNLTQDQVAKMAGIKSTNYYARIERGVVNASHDMLAKIADVLDLKLISR